MTPHAPQPPDDYITITDQDAEKIASKIEEHIKDRFYKNLGIGLWEAAWRAIFIILLAIAAYGAAHK